MSKNSRRIAELEARVDMLEMALNYPQNHKPLGPWPTPRSIQDITDMVKRHRKEGLKVGSGYGGDGWRVLKETMHEMKMSKVDADDLKGFQHPDHPPPPADEAEMPKWFGGTPFERGVIKLDDEYPSGWDKIEADDEEKAAAERIEQKRALAKLLLDDEFVALFNAKLKDAE